MSIDRFLQNSAFTTAHMQAMGEAFDATLTTLRVVDRDGLVAQIAARKIIKLAHEGERDPARLRDEAIMACTVCWH
jgi:hypothetical protein